MLARRFTKYLTRSIALHRRNAAVHLDDVHARLEQAAHRVLYYEQLVAGWRELVASEDALGRDVSTPRAMLERFQVDLEVAMAEKRQAENAQAKMLLDLFEGSRGHLPKTDRELNEWLASPEGKAATLFEPTSTNRWGATGRS